MTHQSRSGDDHGAAAVEFAVLLPLLVVLLVGVLDVGWMIWKRIEMQEAIQEGAIYFAYNPNDEVGAINRALEATNVQITGQNFQNYRPFCQSSGAKTFKIGIEHQLDLLVTSFPVTMKVEVAGDVLVNGGCP